MARRPAPLPAAGKGDYLTRHGFGYSVFEHAEDGIHSEMLSFVAMDATIKYTVISVRNDRNEEIARQVVNVGAVQGNEKRTFTLSIETSEPRK